MKINGISHWWAVYSRNKRSISLDLKKDEGLDLLKELVKADVFIENFVPGTLEKWGVGPEQLNVKQEINYFKNFGLGANWDI